MQVCTSPQTDNHASTPPLSFFTGQMPFLPPNQQRQSTEGTADYLLKIVKASNSMVAGTCYFWASVYMLPLSYGSYCCHRTKIYNAVIILVSISPTSFV